MTASKILSTINKKGITLEAYGDQIIYKAPLGFMTKQLKSEIRRHKQDLLNLLKGNDIDLIPGDCKRCPAGGEWDWKGSGMWCFYSAYFLGMAANPVKCGTAKRNCPIRKKDPGF